VATPVEPMVNDQSVKAVVYVYGDESQLEGSWDYSVFEQQNLQSFLQMITEFAKTHKRTPF
jgi:hypothetical protein